MEGAQYLNDVSVFVTWLDSKVENGKQKLGYNSMKFYMFNLNV